MGRGSLFSGLARIRFRARANGTRLFVTGSSGFFYEEDGAGKFLTVAYDAATGARQWARADRHTTGPIQVKLAVSPDGSRAFVTGGRANESIPDESTSAY